jgi:hypothetical protein
MIEDNGDPYNPASAAYVGEGCMLEEECDLLLADLASVAGRAERLSERFDREHPAVGKLWGLVHALRAALAAAESEFGQNEEN